MISRTGLILARIFYLFSAVFATVSTLLRLRTDIDLVIPAMLLFFLAIIAGYSCTRCPHCRRFGLNPRPFDKNAGYCCRCGKLIEYGE